MSVVLKFRGYELEYVIISASMRLYNMPPNFVKFVTPSLYGLDDSHGHRVMKI